MNLDNIFANAKRFDSFLDDYFKDPNSIEDPLPQVISNPENKTEESLKQNKRKIELINPSNSTEFDNNTRNKNQKKIIEKIEEIKEFILNLDTKINVPNIDSNYIKETLNNLMFFCNNNGMKFSVSTHSYNTNHLLSLLLYIKEMIKNKKIPNYQPIILENNIPNAINTLDKLKNQLNNIFQIKINLNNNTIDIFANAKRYDSALDDFFKDPNSTEDPLPQAISNPENEIQESLKQNKNNKIKIESIELNNKTEFYNDTRNESQINLEEILNNNSLCKNDENNVTTQTDHNQEFIIFEKLLEYNDIFNQMF